MKRTTHGKTLSSLQYVCLSTLHKSFKDLSLYMVMDTSQPKYYKPCVRDAIYRYREKNHDKVLDIAKKASQKWYDENKEKRKESMRQYYYKMKQKKLEESSKTT